MAEDFRHNQQNPQNPQARPVQAPAPVQPVRSNKPTATITWLGEGEDGPRYNEWNGVKFERGVAVTLDPDKVNVDQMVAKARTNRFYSVT